jgi:hypothetical protein
MSGEIETCTGTPAVDNALIAATRRAGVGARGSSDMAIFGSSEVTEIMTLTNPFSAIGVNKSRSRTTRSDFVVIISG